MALANRSEYTTFKIRYASNLNTSDRRKLSVTVLIGTSLSPIRYYP